MRIGWGKNIGSQIQGAGFFQHFNFKGDDYEVDMHKVQKIIDDSLVDDVCPISVERPIRKQFADGA